MSVQDFGAGSGQDAAFAFGAYVVGALFPSEGGAFALSDGTVRFTGGETVQAHEGAVLCAALHPSRSGVVTGGDDGRLVWSRPGGASVLANVGGRWIDAVAASPASGLIAFAAGREAHVRDSADPAFARSFRHERAVADVAFDPKGRRLATATYGQVMLWYARIAEQKPQALKWAGAHLAVLWSPDGRFLLSAMQENSLHGWRLADGKDMRMGGYPSKIRSMAFVSGGRMLATSGAPPVVLWPFVGASGPMGKEAIQLGDEAAADEETVVVRVAAAADGPRLAAALADGRIWVADLRSSRRETVRAATGVAVSALAFAPDGRLAWGDEDGRAGIFAF